MTEARETIGVSIPKKQQQQQQAASIGAGVWRREYA